MNDGRGEDVSGGWSHGENDAKIARKLQTGWIVEARELKRVEVVSGASGWLADAAPSQQLGSVLNIAESDEAVTIRVQAVERVPKHQDFENQRCKAGNRLRN